MRQCLPLGILCAALLAAPAHAAVRKAPAGAKFYSAPSKLVNGGHGGLIWARTFTTRERLKGGARDAATFKWSRENGSVVTSIEKVNGPVVTVKDPGRDEVLGFAGGEWVELVDDE